MSLIHKECVIIGAGISGLSAATFIGRHGIGDVALLEGRPQVGGLIGSHLIDGILCEDAANGYLSGSSDDAIETLIDLVGLRDHVCQANDQSKHRFIVHNSELHPVPLNPWQLLGSPLLSWRGKLRLASDFLMSPLAEEESDHNESVGRFVARHFGQEVVDRFVDPFVSGVWAGDVEQLHAASVFPQLLEAERNMGSIIRGMIKQGKAARAMGQSTKRQLKSFRAGMGELMDSCAARFTQQPRSSLLTSTRVDSIEPFHDPDRGAGYLIKLHNHGVQSRMFAPQVVVATNCRSLGGLLKQVDDEAAGQLARTPHANLVSLTVGFKHEQVGHPLDGYGCLIPRREGFVTLGALWNSTLFPARAPEDEVSLTILAGGMNRPDVIDQDEATLCQRLVAECAALLEIKGEPVMSRLQRYPAVIPQYDADHPRRRALIKQLEQENPGLYLTGNYIDGLSVAHCVERSHQVADNVHFEWKRTQKWKKSSLSVRDLQA